MFDATAQARTGVVDQDVARYAFLESFTIYTRGLLQFFHTSVDRDNGGVRRAFRVREHPSYVDIGKAQGVYL